mgnify:CR=1 FL=1
MTRRAPEGRGFQAKAGKTSRPGPPDGAGLPRSTESPSVSHPSISHSIATPIAVVSSVMGSPARRYARNPIRA